MKLSQAITDALKVRSEVRDVERMVEGDHWLDGRGWVGPKFREGSDGAQEILTEIRRQFVSKNTVNEVCKRHRDAVVGREPGWSIVVDRDMEVNEEPTEAEKGLMDEAEQLLTSWFDRREVQREVQDAVKTVLWARIDGKRAVSPLRLYLPDIELDENGNIPEGLEPFEIITKIKLQHLSPTKCGVVVDEHGNDVAAFYRYKTETGDLEETELTITGRSLRRFDPELAAEAERLEGLGGFEDSDTLVLVLKDQGEPIRGAAYPLGGRLLIYELAREPLITEPTVQLQKLLNLSMTMMSHNVVMGGFLERTVLNGQRPGRWVNPQGGPADPTDAEASFIPDPLAVGAGATNFLMGEPIYDRDTGEITGYTSPSLIYREPVPVDTFRDTVSEVKNAIYEDVNQMHVLITGDATTSGASRRQATDDFVASLATTSKEVEVALRWALETALAWYAYLDGKGERYNELKAVITPYMTAVQPTSEELRLAIDQYNANIISQTTAMSRSGVEDTDAEMDRILAERDRDLQLRPLVPGELDPADDPADEDEEEPEDEE